MKKLWICIDDRKWRAETKYRIVYLLTEALFALVGLSAWLIVRTWALSTWGWMLCFIGYPVIIAKFIVFFYSCRHDFHEKDRV